jgi:hypothetical protein
MEEIEATIETSVTRLRSREARHGIELTPEAAAGPSFHRIFTAAPAILTPISPSPR